MKRMTPRQIETAIGRAANAARYLQDDEDRAEEFESMSIEEYAAERGIEIVDENPKRGAKKMATQREKARIARLETELEEANARIEELEDERADAISAFSEASGVEIIDDGESDEDDSDEDDSDEE